MRFNPEFKRNLWLEMTPQRLLAVPFIIGAVLLLVYLIVVSEKNAVPEDGLDAVNKCAVILIVLLLTFWGSKATSESVINEALGGTWDAQKMSVIGAWRLTWGKLFGSSVCSWYGTAFLTAAFFATLGWSSLKHPVKAFILAVAIGLLTQAIGLLISVGMIRKAGEVSSRSKAGFLPISFVASVFFLQMVYGYSRLREVRVSWFFIPVDYSDFLIGSVVVFLAWAVFGAYNLMREELRVRTSCLALPAFAVFLSLYNAGFVSEFVWHGSEGKVFGEYVGYDNEVMLFLGTAWCVTTAALVYVAFLADRKDTVAARSLFRAIKHYEWRDVTALMPSWAAVLPVVAVAVVFTELYLPSNAHGVAVAMFFFIIRDISVALYLNLAKNKKRADVAAVLYLAVVYGVVPGIFIASGQKAVGALFWPSLEPYSYLSAVAALIEAAFMLFLLRSRWKKNYGTPSAPIQEDVIS